MDVTRLQQLLASLDAKEVKSFTAFLNWQVQVNPRHKHVLPAMKKLIAGEWATQKKSGDKKFNAYLLADLSVYLQTFLVYRQAYLNDDVYRNLLMKEMSKRNLVKPFNTLYKEIKSKQLATATHDYGNLYLYEAEKKYYELAFATPSSKAIPDFTSIGYFLDAHYVLHKLKLFCETINYSNVKYSESKSLLLEPIIELIRHGLFDRENKIMIYYHVFMTLIEPNDETHYRKLRELVGINHAAMDGLELMDMYHYLKNYCTRKINKGQLVYRKELILVYQEMMSVKNLFRKQWLSQWDYKNAVTVSLREKQFDWTKKFIEKYNGYLVAVERKNAYRFNMAAWLFAQGQYKEARRLLHLVNMDDDFYRLDARLMMVKIYVEIDDTDGLYYQVASFKKFLYRNKHITTFQKNIYMRFLKIINRLQKAYDNRSLLKKLQKELSTAKDIADIQWLRDKIEERL